VVETNLLIISVGRIKRKGLGGRGKKGRSRNFFLLGTQKEVGKKKGGAQGGRRGRRGGKPLTRCSHFSS